MSDKTRGQIAATPLSSYPPQDQAFFRFWYGHMRDDLMQPPLANIDHSTARYVWDAATSAQEAQIAMLREALRPFVDCTVTYFRDKGVGARARLTREDIERARAALAATGERS